MARWAYHIDDPQAPHLAGRLVLDLTPAALLTDAFDVEILVSQRRADGIAVFVGSARPEGPADQADHWRINWFAAPVPRADPFGLWEVLEERRFEDILAQGRSRALISAEAAAPYFGEDEASLATYHAVVGQAVLAFGGACALTGEAEGGHGATTVAIIRPASQGGALHVGNFLPLSEPAARAFDALHIAIGPKFEILADLSLVDPELAEALNPSGRLARPINPHHVIDPQSLAWHRHQFFERLGGA